jgi:hypothetical protein
MVVTRTLDFAHSVIARVNSDPSSEGSWVGTLMLAGLLLPSVLGIAGTTGLSKGEAALYSPIALLAAAAYAYLRRAELQSLREALAQPVPLRLRLIACLFLFCGASCSALAARVAPWAGPVVLSLVAVLPWQRWAGLSGVP